MVVKKSNLALCAEDIENISISKGFSHKVSRVSLMRETKNVATYFATINKNQNIIIDVKPNSIDYKRTDGTTIFSCNRRTAA